MPTRPYTDEPNIVRYTEAELRQMKSETDHARLAEMTDEDIAQGIAADPDTTELTDEYWKRARPAREVLKGISKEESTASATTTGYLKLHISSAQYIPPVFTYRQAKSKKA